MGEYVAAGVVFALQPPDPTARVRVCLVGPDRFGDRQSCNYFAEEAELPRDSLAKVGEQGQG